MENKISENDFEEIYKPQQNHLDKDAEFNGCMYETFGEELEYILSLARNPETAKRVWTILDSDGAISYAAMYHIVNRLGYLVTEKPCENETDFVELEHQFN